MKFFNNGRIIIHGRIIMQAKMRELNLRLLYLLLFIGWIQAGTAEDWLIIK